jgi:hypothetical protein
MKYVFRNIMYNLFFMFFFPFYTNFDWKFKFKLKFYYILFVEDNKQYCQVKGKNNTNNYK